MLLKYMLIWLKEVSVQMRLNIDLNSQPIWSISLFPQNLAGFARQGTTVSVNAINHETAAKKMQTVLLMMKV